MCNRTFYNKGVRHHPIACKNAICIKYDHVWWANVYDDAGKADQFQNLMEKGKPLDKVFRKNSVNEPTGLEICFMLKHAVESRIEIINYSDSDGGSSSNEYSSWEDLEAI